MEDSLEESLDESAIDMLDDSAIEQIVEEDDFKETVAFEGISLDDLPDEEPDDQAEG